MRVIRKFVACVRVVAAGLGAVLVLGLSLQTATAHVVAPAGPPSQEVSSLSPQCLGAVQAIRDALVADRQEDAEEVANPSPSGEVAEDSAELAHFRVLIASVRDACAAQIAAARTTPEPTAQTTLSTQCLAAVQAWKAYAKLLWSQHVMPTVAQLAQLRQLGEAVRAACGWAAGNWSTAR
jgi:hypothetical protein